MAGLSRPDAATRERLRKLGELHDEWEAAHEGSTPFEPAGRKAGSDYNVHTVDISGSADTEADFQRRARRAMGL